MTYKTVQARLRIIAAITLCYTTTSISCDAGAREARTVYGQDPPGLQPVRFAPEVLTAEKRPHSSLTFSPDGKEVFWSAFLGDWPNQTVFFSTFDGKSLSAPRVAPFAIDSHYGGPAFTQDGNSIFFNSQTVLAGAQDERIFAVSSVSRTPDGWSAPQQLTVTADPSKSVGQVSVARNGNLYFSGRRWTEPLPKLYRSELGAGGVYTVPETLEGPVNAAGAVDPFVDPDERFLLFTGVGRGDGFGITDIYVSYRQDDGSWGEPINLGDRVNSELFERFPSLSRDGRYLFFIRAAGEQYTTADAHFYWVSADVLDSLDPQ